MRIDIGVHPDYKVPETVSFAQRVESAGFGGVWIADSQDLFRDCFVSATAVALACRSIDIGIGVTNPVLRHPSVLAGGIASIEEVASARVMLGIGTGETAVHTAGLKRARLADMEVAIRRCREFLNSPWGGPPSTARILMAATGPRSLGVAGAVADGAYLKIGCDPKLNRWAAERICDGSRSRAVPGTCCRVLLLPVALADRPEQAYREVAGFAAATAEAVCGAVPHEIIPSAVRDDVLALAEAARRARRLNDYAHWLDDPNLLGSLPRAALDLFCIACSDGAELRQRIAQLDVDQVVIPLLTRRRGEQLDRLAAALVKAA